MPSIGSPIIAQLFALPGLIHNAVPSNRVGMELSVA